MSEHNEEKYTFFDETTTAIGFVYSIIAIAIIVAIYAIG